MTTSTAPQRALKVGQIGKHLDLLGYRDNEPVYLRFFYPEGHPKKDTDKGIKAQHPKGQLDYQSIARYQKDGRGCYFVVNGQGHKDESVVTGRAIFYEHDDMRKEIQKDLWQHLGLPEPTFQVDTGGKSVHSYWVFDQPIPAKDWKQLQSDLLEHADGDRKIKNPSRVMRLAGCYHTGANQQSEIIAKAGSRYSYEQLRSIIPVHKKEAIQNNWADFDRSFSLPTVGQVPLTECLTKDHREALSRGAGQGGRNCDGFSLAKDLLGAADALRSMGQAFDGDPRRLFDQFCDSCTPPLAQSERDSIWKSACSGDSGPALSPEQMEGCIKGWAWRQAKSQEHWEERPKTLKESQESVVSQENGYAELRLAISGLLALQDPEERDYKFYELANEFRKPISLIRKIANNVTKIRDTSKSSFTIEDFENLEIKSVPFLIPRFIPEVGLTCLGGYAKDGKSTFMYEIVASLVKGEPLLGFKPSKKCRVLLIQTEEPEPTIFDNLDGKGLLYNPDVPKDGLRIEKRWAIDDTAKLEQWIAEYDPDFICFDSFRMLNKDTGISENSPEAANAVYGIQAILHRYKKAGLLIHHTTKNKEASGIQRLGGSSSIPGACDNIMMLSRVGQDPEDPRRQLFMTGRNIKGRFIVQWETGEYPTFEWTVVSESGIDSEAKNLQQRVLDAIKLNQRHNPNGITASAIKDILLLDKSNKSVYKAIKLLVDTGTLSVGYEPQKRGRALRKYFLPSLDTNSGPPDEMQPGQDFEKVSNKVSSKYPSSIQVPETHTTDTPWKRPDEVDTGSPIISDKGGQTQWRKNHAPYMPKRNPGILEQHEKRVTSNTKNTTDTTGIPDGYFVDTNLDTFSNEGTASVLGDGSIDSIHGDTKEGSQPAPIEPGTEVEYTYHSCPQSEQDEVVRNKEHPPKGTKGVVVNVRWVDCPELSIADWMIDVIVGDDYYESAGMEYLSVLQEVPSGS